MRLRGWAMLATLALAGCAVAPRAPESGIAPDTDVLRQWEASGRMAIAAGGDGGSGSFAWSQDDATTRLDLRGPLGAGALRMIVTPDAMSLEDGGGRVLDAQAARAELAARLGADLPWTYLRFWMLGLAAPGEEAVVSGAVAAPGRVIDQSGWRLAYDAFAVVGGFSLPKRFSAERDGVRVRVVVDSWKTESASGAAPTVPR